MKELYSAIKVTGTAKLFGNKSDTYRQRDWRKLPGGIKNNVEPLHVDGDPMAPKSILLVRKWNSIAMVGVDTTEMEALSGRRQAVGYQLGNGGYMYALLSSNAYFQPHPSDEDLAVIGFRVGPGNLDPIAGVYDQSSSAMLAYESLRLVGHTTFDAIENEYPGAIAI